MKHPKSGIRTCETYHNIRSSLDDGNVANKQRLELAARRRVVRPGSGRPLSHHPEAHPVEVERVDACDSFVERDERGRNEWRKKRERERIRVEFFFGMKKKKKKKAATPAAGRKKRLTFIQVRHHQVNDVPKLELYHVVSRGAWRSIGRQTRRELLLQQRHIVQRRRVVLRRIGDVVEEEKLR